MSVSVSVSDEGPSGWISESSARSRFGMLAGPKPRFRLLFSKGEQTRTMNEHDYSG